MDTLLHLFRFSEISIQFWMVSNFGDFIILTFIPGKCIYLMEINCHTLKNTDIEFMKRMPPRVIWRTNFPQTNALCDIGLERCHQSYVCLYAWNSRGNQLMCLRCTSIRGIIIIIIVSLVLMKCTVRTYTNCIRLFGPASCTRSQILVLVL